MSLKFPVSICQYSSFDGGVSSKNSCQSPDRYAFWDENHANKFLISRGSGLSYADASFSSTSVTVEHNKFNRILSFNNQENIIEVESGISLGEIYDFLTPKNLFLPVQPGYPKISIGGCIAADVHGKNQFQDGTFISQVKTLKLFHPQYGTLEVSPEQNNDLFRLTCGGYGLTGSILSAKLQLKNIPSNFVEASITPIDNIYDLVEILNQAIITSDLVYTWHNFTAQGKQFGQGFIKEAKFVNNQLVDGKKSQHTLKSLSRQLNATTRSNWIFTYLNQFTTPAFNDLYCLFNKVNKKESFIQLSEFIFPAYNYQSQIYFKLFGKRGFMEYQAIIPIPTFNQYIRAIQLYLSRKPLSVTLASAKIFRGSRELLRFTGDGICFALNLSRNVDSIHFMQYLDQLIIDLGGIPNIIKDSRLPQHVVAKTYSGYDYFRERILAYDPERLYRSGISQRLGL